MVHVKNIHSNAHPSLWGTQMDATILEHGEDGEASESYSRLVVCDPRECLSQA